MKIFIKITLLSYISLVSPALFAKSQKIYINALEAGAGISKPMTRKVKDKLELFFFEEGKGKFRIVSEEDIKIMYKQAAELQKSGCSAEQCLMQIGNAIDADLLIAGRIEMTGTKIHIVARSLIRNKQTDELSRSSMTDEEFFEYQMDWFLGEMVKKLINPGYTIDKSKAPADFKISIDTSNIEIKEIASLGINPLTFKTDDQAIERILNVLKEEIRQSDNYYKNKQFSEALNNYLGIIQKIETKLVKAKQEKLSDFKDSIHERITSAYAMLYKQKMENIDKQIKDIGLDEAMRLYKEEKQNMINSVPEIYLKRLSQIKTAFIKRIDSIYSLKAQKIEKEGAAIYSDYEFEKAMVKYDEAIEIMKNVTEKDEPKNSEYVSALEQKKKAAKDTSYSYFTNKVSSFDDQINFYNIKDEISKARSLVSALFAFIVNSFWKNDEQANKKYNDLAALLKVSNVTYSNMVLLGLVIPGAGHLYADQARGYFYLGTWLALGGLMAYTYGDYKAKYSDYDNAASGFSAKIDSANAAHKRYAYIGYTFIGFHLIAFIDILVTGQSYATAEDKTKYSGLFRAGNQLMVGVFPWQENNPSGKVNEGVDLFVSFRF
jgi:hypothetical protein